jgi:hypothetical protein
MTINAVTGESEFKLSAGAQRIGDSFFSWFSGNCGKSARWFEPARERPL